MPAGIANRTLQEPVSTAGPGPDPAVHLIGHLDVNDEPFGTNTEREAPYFVGVA
jgi:hypothetical protein